MKLEALLQELRSYPPEALPQPELKQHRQAQDEKIREEQDLANGAVMQAEVEAGTGDECPSEGDLVFVHVSISPADEPENVVYSTRADQGGPGQPLAFILQKGARAPRAWEIALQDMHRGGRVALKVKPSYGYHHPTCKLAAPPRVPSHQALAFDLQLIDWIPAVKVRAVGDGDTTYKRVLRESSTWETARPPFEVTFNLTLRILASDGVPRSGAVLYSSLPPSEVPGGTGSPIVATLGQGALPAGLEEALTHVSKGEHAVFILPAANLRPATEVDGTLQRPQLPAPPAEAVQIEAEVELLGVVQVRDMTGTGEVTKRRIKEGTGEFPIDCPLNDTTVRLHWRVRPVDEKGVRGPWLCDTRKPSTGPVLGQPPSTPPPIEIDTGCGEAPEAVEMCAKLMLPGEVSLVCATSLKYAYEGRTDAPQGLQGAAAVEWEVELVSFDREGHWQVMEMEERFGLAERVKAKANALVKAGRHGFAHARYARLLKLMNSTRDYETEEEVRRMEGLKLAVIHNLALCALALGEYVEAVRWCNKALEHDEKSAKAYFRRGRALSLKGDYEDAEGDLKAALELDGSYSADVERELVANRKRAKDATAKQKQQFANFFGR